MRIASSGVALFCLLQLSWKTPSVNSFTPFSSSILHQHAGKLASLSALSAQVDDSSSKMMESLLNNAKFDKVASQAGVAPAAPTVTSTQTPATAAVDQLQTPVSIPEFDLPSVISSAFHNVQSALSDLSLATLPSSIPTPLIALTAFSATMTIVFYKLSHPDDDFRKNAEPYPRGNYDPIAARQYYSTRPLLVLSRAAQIFRLSNTFLFNLLVDKYIFRNTERNIDARAQELLQLIQKIGPTAIKVGQALSVRQDLISEAYAKALVELQDNVPPFPSDEASDLLRSELGEARFQRMVAKGLDLSKPVASASIGQVYRGYASVPVKKAVNGGDDDGSNEEVEYLDFEDDWSGTTEMRNVEVAVKVQRPNALSEIALDLFLVREFAPYYQKLTGSATDLQALANEWGRGFIAELTYEEEKRNTIRFNEEMKQKNLNAVCAPTVIPTLSTNRILTTEWVQGARLDQSQEDDVARLCGVALNAYLVMLLETGTLHCDPHPGNLLRTNDGKLCILDFGMTLDTPKDLQYSLLEFIAHLTAENFEDVPQDLVQLQFLKEEKVDLLVKTGALEPLYYFLRQANQGGGGTKVRERIYEEYREKYPGVDDEELRTYMRAEIKASQEEMAEKASAVTGITMKVEDLQRQNSDAFSIPEWFLYTSRAFLTLEGISLQADSDFSIVKSCFPYVAKRLLGDDSPRSQAALRDLIYGQNDSINAEKITELADGFTQYTTTTKIVSQGGGVAPTDSEHKGGAKNDNVSTEAALTLAKDSADILLAPNGNLVQNVLIEESATALTANIKDGLREALLENPERIRSSLPLGLGNFLPKGPVQQVDAFLQKSEKEEQVQFLAQKLTSLATLPSPPSPEDFANMIRNSDSNESTVSLIENMDAEEIAMLWKAIRENAPIYGPRLGILGGKLASSILGKVSDNIDGVIAKNGGEHDKLEDQAVSAAAQAVSAAAKNSINALKPLITTAEK